MPQSSPQGRIRVAILGFGTSGRIFHAPFLAADPRFHIAAIVTGDPEKRRLAASEHPDARLLDTAGDVWSDASAYDLVIVGTPSSTHEHLAHQALDAGLHVVVDKPFALSSEGGRAVIAHAHRAQRTVTVFQNRRWDGDYLTVRRLIADGELGDVHRFESRFEWWKPEQADSWKTASTRADGGGILYDLGTHVIDQAIRLFGPVAEVTAEVDRRRERVAAEDDVFVALRHANGTRSHLWMNAVAPAAAPRFHVSGSRAGYTSWGLDGQEPALIAGDRPGSPGFGVTPEDRWGTIGAGGRAQPVAAERGDYGAFYRGLASALLEGGPPPVDPHDAVEVLEVIERVFAQHPSPSSIPSERTPAT